MLLIILKIRVATRMQMPKGQKKKEKNAHPLSQSGDPTGISAKGLAPTGISSGIGYLFTPNPVPNPASVRHPDSSRYDWYLREDLPWFL